MLLDLLNNYCAMARKFELDDLNIFDVPKHRDALIKVLKCMEESPLGEDDGQAPGFELKFKRTTFLP